jgi:hypothetical protein
VSKSWTAEQVLDVLSNRISHLDNEMHRELEGFPEHYATQVEIDLLRQAIDAIRLDHVARRELDDVKSTAASSADRLQVRLDEQAGRRQATTISISVVATILAVMFGFIWNSQITRAEVSDQIAREAPWIKDKTAIEAHIAKLEANSQAQRLQITQLQIQSRFFCATRTKAGLPGC